jgi:hypothetical protein
MMRERKTGPQPKKHKVAADLIAVERQEAFKSHEIYSVSALAGYFEDLCHFDVT